MMKEDREWGEAHPQETVRRRRTSHAELAFADLRCRDAGHYSTLVIYTDNPGARFRRLQHVTPAVGAVGRNRPCPCRYTRKFKHCRGRGRGDDCRAA
jgi:hypothetical protein